MKDLLNYLEEKDQVESALISRIKNLEERVKILEEQLRGVSPNPSGSKIP